MGAEVYDETGAAPSGRARPRWRRVAARAVTLVAGLLVLVVLVAPSERSGLAPAAFARVPVEGLLGFALILVLAARPRRVVAILIGVALGALAIVRIADVGFLAVLDRPFDPILDWSFLESGTVFLSESSGRAGAVAAVLAAAALAVVVLVVMVWAVLRLADFAVRHRVGSARTTAVLAVAWVACAALALQVVPGAPVAAHTYYDRLLRVRASLQDEAAFAASSSIDAFRGASGEDLLTALRGKDVLVISVESYGRVAVEHPELATQVGAVLDAAGRRLRAAGFASRSAFLTSPTVGGGSWLAHATLMSGLWVDNQQRYDHLLASDRLTLGGAFRRAGWRTVGVMPGLAKDWPQGAFFGNDIIYGARDLGYRGPDFSFATTPDQYTLSVFQRLERSGGPRAPVMADIPLVSSHAPWSPIPTLIDWDDVRDGSTFAPPTGASDPADIVWQRDPARVRADYGRAIAYSLNVIVSYVERYGDDNLVVAFLGDHQPAPVIAGAGASRDAPIAILARDPAVMSRISGWGWQDGPRPGPNAPVWRMDTFRDRFLAAFSPPPDPVARPAPTPR